MPALLTIATFLSHRSFPIRPGPPACGFKSIHYGSNQNCLVMGPRIGSSHILKVPALHLSLQVDILRVPVLPPPFPADVRLSGGAAMPLPTLSRLRPRSRRSAPTSKASRPFSFCSQAAVTGLSPSAGSQGCPAHHQSSYGDVPALHV